MTKAPKINLHLNTINKSISTLMKNLYHHKKCLFICIYDEQNINKAKDTKRAIKHVFPVHNWAINLKIFLQL